MGVGTTAEELPSGMVSGRPDLNRGPSAPKTTESTNYTKNPLKNQGVFLCEVGLLWTNLWVLSVRTATVPPQKLSGLTRLSTPFLATENGPTEVRPERGARSLYMPLMHGTENVAR